MLPSGEIHSKEVKRMFTVALKKFAPNPALVCAYACALYVKTGILALDNELFGIGASPP